MLRHIKRFEYRVLFLCVSKTVKALFSGLFFFCAVCYNAFETCVQVIVLRRGVSNRIAAIFCRVFDSSQFTVSADTAMYNKIIKGAK